MPLDHYLAYCAILTRTYGPAACPTREQWLLGCTAPRKPKPSDFDIETEKREGWTYD